MQGNAQYIRAQLDDAGLMRLRVRIMNDAGTLFDITDRFGESPDYTRIKSIPVFTLGAEQSSPRTGTAFVPQATDITLDNEDGWWNGRVNADLAHRCRADVKDSVGFYNSTPLTDGDLTDDDTATYAWKSEIDTDNDIWVAHNSKNTIKWAGAQQYWPTGWAPQRFKLQYGDDLGGWTDIVPGDITASTNVTNVVGNWYSADARRTAFVFTVKSGKGLRIVQAEDFGNAGHLNQMSMNISEVTASSTMPRLDIASWKGKQIRFTNYQYCTDTESWENFDIVTVVIDDITHPRVDEITLKLRDLGLLLRKKDAGLVKRGLQHWRGRPIGQLLRHLLLQAFTAAEVDSWSNIPDGPITQTLDDTTQRSASTFGPASRWKAIQSIYDFADVDPRLVCEAIYEHPANNKLYLGFSDYFDNSINMKLYEFDPTSFTLTDVTGVSLSGYKVWLMDYYDDDNVIVAVVGNDSETNARTCTMKILTATPGGNFSEVHSRADVTPGMNCWRQGSTRQYFDGALYWSLRGIGHMDETHAMGDRYFGENLTFPFPQLIRSSDGEPENSGGILDPRATIVQAYTAEFGATGNDYNPYFEPTEAYRTWFDFHFQSGSYPGYPNAFNVKFSLGQRRCIGFAPNSANGMVYFITYVGTTYTVRYYNVGLDTDISTGLTWAESSVGISPFVPTADYYMQPTCLAVADSGSYFYMGLVQWDDRDGGASINPSTAYLATWNAAGVIQGSKQFSATDETYMVPISVCAMGNTAGAAYRLFGCVLQRDAKVAPWGAGTEQGKVYGFQYSPFVCDHGTSNFYYGNEITNGGFSSAKPFLGFKWNGSNSTTDRRTYFVDTASGMMYYFYFDAHDRNIGRVNTIGGPAVDGEHDLATQFLAVNYNTTAASEIVYGVSAPGVPGNFLEIPLSGRYELFKVANDVNYTIPIADFDGFNCWKAIGHIARPIDYVYGFDPGGDFYFHPRDDGSSPNDYTFVDPQDLPVVPESGTIKRIAAYMSLDSGYAQIANVVNVKPTTALLGEVKGQGTFQIRPEGEEDFKSELVANQSDSFAHSIILDCVRQGQPIVHNHATSPQVRFRGFIYRFDIRTVLASNHTSGDSSAIELVDTGYNGLYISPGDFILIGGDPLNRISVAYTDVIINANYLSVNLDTGIGRDYAAGTKVTIYKQTHMQATDSDFGVTTLEEAYTAGDGYLRVNSARFISVDIVLMIADSQYRVTGITEEAPDSRWNIDVEDSISRSPDASHLIDSVVKAFWAPNAKNMQFGIFGTGVSLAIHPPDDGASDTEAEKKQRKTFLVGDRIRIESPGLELKEQAKSYAQSRDQTSIDKYGEEEYRGPEVTQNRFMNHVLANEVSKAVLVDVKDPHWRPGLTVDKFMNIFLPGDPFYTSSQRLYPMETDNKITVEAMQVEMTYPTANQAGRTVFKTRAVDSYEG